MNPVKTVFFQVNAVIAAINLFERRQRRFFVPIDCSYIRYFTG